MANDNNPIFKIDAAEILAKLHLAGKEQAKNFTIINSAIENDNGTSPQNIGNTTFNLKSKDGKYEICLIEEIIYPEQLNLDLDPQLQKLKKNIGKKPLINKSEKPGTLSKNDKAYLDRLKALGVDTAKIEKNFNEEEIKKAVDELNKKRKEQKEKIINKFKADAFKAIKDQYFLNFGGKELSSKLKLIDGKTSQMPVGSNKKVDLVQINEFTIMPISAEEQKKWQQELIKDMTKLDKVTMDIGFKIGYRVETETM